MPRWAWACPSPSIADDPGALLAAMLQGVETEIRQPRRVRDPGNAEDTAHVLMLPSRRW